MSGRDTQGKFQPIVPPFIAPLIGNSTDPGDEYGENNNYPPVFGEVQATATGPEAMESVFATAFSLDPGNTALPGGHFFEESRTLETIAGGVVSGISSAASGNGGGRPDGRVITDWLFYARGFTFGGFTGTTSGTNPIVGTPNQYNDVAGNTLSDLYINPMDLPTIPYGSYSDLPYYDDTGRTTNKVLQITGTGTTFSANFRSAKTDMQFSINHIPEKSPNHTGTSLIVQSLSTTNARPLGFGTQFGNSISTGINQSAASDLNRSQVGDGTFYDRSDEVFVNASSDILFIFNYPNNSDPVDSSRYFPIGNVLKCHFPVPVRGVAITTLDQNQVSFNVTSPSRSAYRGSRIFVEGDFADGSTFTYVMFPRGGGGANGSNNNSCGFMSYLALNSRSDKHIKNLYISNVWWDPITQGTGTIQSGHLPHGKQDFLGPGRFYCGDHGMTSSFQILSGPSTAGGGSTGPSYPGQDDIAVKINVMPRYDRNFFQVDKRPNGLDGQYGQYDLSVRSNAAAYNEWRKITKDQIGKTFGKTGAFVHPADSPPPFQAPLSLGTGVVFNKAGTGGGFGGRTGDILDISMSFMPDGDSNPQSTITGATLHNGEIVEAFRYEVIKGTTVDGQFIGVWTKSRTL